MSLLDVSALQKGQPLVKTLQEYSKKERDWDGGLGTRLGWRPGNETGMEAWEQDHGITLPRVKIHWINQYYNPVVCI